MSFGGGFGGAEEVLAYMIKAYDTATPVFKAFGGEVEATTTRVRAALDSVNRTMMEQERIVKGAVNRETLSLRELQAAYERTGVKSVELAKMQSDMAKKSVVASEEQAAAAKKSADEQVAAYSRADAARASSTAGLARAGRDIMLLAVGGAAASLDFAVKFQANTLRMETQAGATAKGLDQIRQGLVKMAGQVGVTPNQLANGMYHVVSSMNAVLPAATRVQQELRIMKIAAEGAQIGHSNLEETTYALSSAMNALHQNAGQAQKTMADLNAIVGAGDMNMQDLVNALKSGIIPAAQTFGISLQSVGSALAVMGDMGMRGAIAGTRLRMAISLLAAPTKQAAGILETLGMNSKEALASTERMSKLLAKAGISVTTLSNDLRKPDGLAVALADLNHHLQVNGLSADAAGAAIDRAFGGGRMGATIKLLAENTDRLHLKFQQISQMEPQFGKDWQKTSETLRVQLDKALASVEALGIGLGNDLMPAATHALHDLENMANWLLKNKWALDLLGGAVITFSTVAIGTYLIGKLRAAAGLMESFGVGTANLGRWFMGGTMGGGGTDMAGRKTITKMTGHELATVLGQGQTTPGAIGSSVMSGGIWGISGTQIRVGTLMNPLAVTVVGRGGSGGIVSPSTGAPTAEAGMAMSAEEKAMLAEVDAALAADTAATKDMSALINPMFLNKGGKPFFPAAMGGRGQFVGEAQAATLSGIAASAPGAASLAEMKAAEEAAATAAATQAEQLFWHVTPTENIPSIKRQGLLPSEPVYGDNPMGTYTWSHPKPAAYWQNLYTEPGLPPHSTLRMSVPPTTPFLRDQQLVSSQAFYSPGGLPPTGISTAGTLAQEEAALRANLAERQMAAARAGQVHQAENLFAGTGTMAESGARGSQLSLFDQVVTGRTNAELKAMSIMEANRQRVLLPQLMKGAESGGGPGMLSGLAGLGGNVAGGIKTFGGNLMRGLGMAGMGVFMSQMMGQMIPGQLGHKISDIGTFGSIGAGLGTAVMPGVGTVVGGLGGALAGIFKQETHDLLFGTKPGTTSVKSLGAGFSTPDTKKQIEGLLNNAADINGLTKRAGGGGGGILGTIALGAQQVAASVTHPFSNVPDVGKPKEGTLTPEQIVKRADDYRQAGLLIAGSLNAGWNQYSFQSEPTMFRQFRSKVKNMPTETAAAAAESAVAFAQGLEKKGRLTAGSAQNLVADIEAQFPGLAKYMGKTATEASGAFKLNFNLDQAEQNTKIALASVSNDFAGVQYAVSQTTGTLQDKISNVAIPMLKNLAKGFGPMADKAKEDLKLLATSADQNFGAAAQAASSSANIITTHVKGIRKAVVTETNTAFAIGSANFTNLAKSFANSIGQGGEATAKGLQNITDQVNSALKQFGQTPLNTVEVKALGPTNLAAIVSGQVSSNGMLGGVQVPGMPAGTTFGGHATGAKVLEPSYVVGEEAPAHPEYVLATNPAYRPRNVSLWHQAGKDLGIPGFAQGGYVFPFPRGEKFGWDRIDQGQDLQGIPGGPVLAIGPGNVTVGHDAFSGFGPFYPIETLSSGPWAGRGIYYGHTKDTVTGPVRAGEIIGYTQSQAKQWTDAPAGWLELGFTTALGQGITGQGRAVAPMLHALAAGHMVAGMGGGAGAVDIRAPAVSGGGVVGAIVKAAMAKAARAATSFVNKQMGTGGVSGATGQLVPGIMAIEQQAARIAGLAFNAPVVAELLTKESGGGHNDPPSGPLSATGPNQVIPGTFAAYAIPGHKNIDNPLDNAIASMRYIKSRYHSLAAMAAATGLFGAGYHGYKHGGRIPAFAGMFGDGGMFTAHGPTVGVFGERGAEDVIALPHHLRGAAITGTSQSSSSSGAHSYSTTNTSQVGGQVVTTTETTSTSSKGNVTTRTTTHEHPAKVKSHKLTAGFNPMTDRIETHNADDWRLIHAKYAKQRHDAAQEKKKYDAWLAENVKDMLTVGGLAAGAVDLTRKQALAEHLPTGGINVGLTAGNLHKLSDKGFTQVLSGLKHYLAIDDLSDSMKLMTKELRELPKHLSPTSRGAQVENTLITAVMKGVAGAFTNQQKQFQHADTVAGLVEGLTPGTKLGLSGAQLMALGFTKTVGHGKHRRTVGDRGALGALEGSDSGPAAFQHQITELSGKVIPEYKHDAHKLTVAYKASLKTHNKKLQEALKTQLDAVTQAELQAVSDKQKAQVSLIDSVYTKSQNKVEKLQSGVDLLKAVQGMSAGTNVAATLGLSGSEMQTLASTMGLKGVNLNSFTGNANPMGLAQAMNANLGQERSTDAGALKKLIDSLPSLKGTALDEANQHIKDLSQSIASLTTEINANLMDAIKAVDQGFQDMADLAKSGADIYTAIGNLPTGTDLSSIGLSPAALQALGIDPATAASIEGQGPGVVGGSGSSSFVSGLNSYLTNERTDLTNELNNDVASLPSLTGQDHTDMLAHIASLSGTILSLTDAIQKNTGAVNANTASTTSTGQMTGTVAYTYQGQGYTAGLSSDAPVNLGVGG